jgi:hypothetical protein
MPQGSRAVRIVTVGTTREQCDKVQCLCTKGHEPIRSDGTRPVLWGNGAALLVICSLRLGPARIRAQANLPRSRLPRKRRGLDRVSTAEGALDQSLFDLTQIIPTHEFRFVDQFLAALVPMTATVIVHAQGMGLVRREFKRFAGRESGPRSEGPSVILVTAIVATMLATHFLEVVAWAGFYIVTGLIPNTDTAMQFSMANYSTLGSGIALAERWRGLAGFEAMTSMLMFGWSTAVLAAVVQKANNVAS